MKCLKYLDYGTKGEFALNLYFFQRLNELKPYFKIQNEGYEFEYDILLDKIRLNLLMT